MGLESVSVVSDLVVSNPLSTDLESQGDDHLRAIKSGLRTTFPNATRPFAFPSTSAAVAANVTVDEATHRNMLVPVNALAAPRTITLPPTPVDGWEMEVMKSDAGSNVVIVTAAQSINGATSVQLTGQHQGVRTQYNAAETQWRGRFQAPTLPYYQGVGTSTAGISIGDLGAKGTSQRIMAASASGESWSAYALASVLDFLSTSIGDIHQKITASQWAVLPASTSGLFLSSKGPGVSLAYDTPTPPSEVFANSFAVINTTSSIPVDNTIPQLSEGVQILSVSLALKKVTSRLRVTATAVGCIGNNGNGSWTLALHHNASVDAVRASNVGNFGGFASMNQIVFEYSPAVSTAISFRVNVGTGTTNPVVLNGDTAGASLFGGDQSFTLRAEEIYI